MMLREISIYRCVFDLSKPELFRTSPVYHEGLTCVSAHLYKLLGHRCHILLHQNSVLVVLTVVKMWPWPLTHIQGTFPCGWFRRQLALWEICSVSCFDVEGRA